MVPDLTGLINRKVLTYLSPSNKWLLSLTMLKSSKSFLCCWVNLGGLCWIGNVGWWLKILNFVRMIDLCLNKT